MLDIILQWDLLFLMWHKLQTNFGKEDDHLRRTTTKEAGGTYLKWLLSGEGEGTHRDAFSWDFLFR